MTVGAKFGKPIYCPPKGTDNLILPMAKVGVEVEIEGYDGSRCALAKWESHEDHSLRGGREFTTRGGMIGEELVNEIHNISTYCLEKNFSDGYPRAGIHLHVDVTDMNEKSNTELLNAVCCYLLFESAMFRFAGDWRRACGFCDPLLLSQSGMPKLAKMLLDWDTVSPKSLAGLDKYQALNFLPLVDYGTIEFRVLPTTFDVERILNWVNICIAFKRFGMVEDTDPVEMLDRLGLKAFTSVVFGKWAKVIAPFIDEREIADAAKEVVGLRAGVATKKNKPKILKARFDEPNNPYLLCKKVEPKATKKKIEPPSIVGELAHPIPMPAQGLAEQAVEMRGVDLTRMLREVQARQERSVEEDERLVFPNPLDPLGQRVPVPRRNVNGGNN